MNKQTEKLSENITSLEEVMEVKVENMQKRK